MTPQERIEEAHGLWEIAVTRALAMVTERIRTLARDAILPQIQQALSQEREAFDFWRTTSKDVSTSPLKNYEDQVIGHVAAREGFCQPDKGLHVAWVNDADLRTTGRCQCSAVAMLATAQSAERRIVIFFDTPERSATNDPLSDEERAFVQDALDEQPGALEALVGPSILRRLMAQLIAAETSAKEASYRNRQFAEIQKSDVQVIQNLRDKLEFFEAQPVKKSGLKIEAVHNGLIQDLVNALAGDQLPASKVALETAAMLGWEPVAAPRSPDVAAAAVTPEVTP